MADTPSPEVTPDIVSVEIQPVPLQPALKATNSRARPEAEFAMLLGTQRKLSSGTEWIANLPSQIRASVFMRRDSPRPLFLRYWNILAPLIEDSGVSLVYK